VPRRRIRPRLIVVHGIEFKSSQFYRRGVGLGLVCAALITFELWWEALGLFVLGVLLELYVVLRKRQLCVPKTLSELMT
jgi:hypothetical protein